ncbi:DNA polymerase III subunit alpha [Atopobacter phocae]|uniref:DNA polymerase III subunit alpha n=1 Tax=Atopobacter phocae TaxID=136492 RepID=UPI00046FC6A4|nr:DNA polymerase III subunit alpha [Atopobacter phocae]
MITPIDVQSDYSFLKSALTITKYVQSGQDLGYETLVLADQDSMMGAIRFQTACLKAHIKPIFGLSHQLSFEPVSEQLSGWADGIFIALTNRGYRQLLKLSTQPDDKFYWSYLQSMNEWKDDLAFIFKLPSQANSSYYHQHLSYMNHLAKGNQSIYFGINTYETDRSFWEQINQYDALQPIALQTVRYINPQDEMSLQVLRSIDQSDALEITQRLDGHQFFITKRIFSQNFSNDYILQEALKNNEQLMKRAVVNIPINQKLLPRFTDEYVAQKLKKATTDHHQIVQEYLKKLCFERLTDLQFDADERYIQRLQYELKVINQMGFSDYFLIVWDLLEYSRSQKIATSPGRGSAAGSLVSYLLQITGLDPIKYDLLFERFLNEERLSMPDIDLDFPDNRRDEIFKYVAEKYGEDHVAQIAAVGTFKARQAIRDVARVAGLATEQINQIAKLIPKTLNITLNEVYDQSVPFKRLINETAVNQRIFEIACQIEGMARHLTTHAAGIVISEEPLTHFTALYKRPDQLLPLTQMQMGELEQIGLLKMDLLSIRNLTIVDWVVQEINRHQTFNVADIPLDDAATYELFKKANTDGVFQFESDGIKRVLKQVQPQSLEELSAVNALFRPGPMEQISLYVRRKFKKEPVKYIHPSIKPLLEKTYGIMIYQEQVMQVTGQMASFSLAEADILRRAMSKKLPHVIEEKRGAFVKGAMNNGYTQSEAQEVFHFIERFANYGFNRSHAMAYSLLAYQMAYLKTHYPAEFYFALLENVNLSSDKGKKYISELREANIQIKGPDINYSSFKTTLNNKTIQLGLSFVKSVPKDLVKQIIAVRNRQGHFESLEQVLTVVDKKYQTTDHFTPLILSGAFDSLKVTRHTMIATLPALIEQFQLFGSNSLLSQKELGIVYKEREEFPLVERLDQENEFLGLTISPHPIESMEWIKKISHCTKLIKAKGQKQRFDTIVYVHDIKRIRTKSGEPMAFMTVSDETSRVELIVFPKDYYQMMTKIDAHQIIYIQVRGDLSKSKDWQMILEQVYDLELIKKKISAQDKRLFINWSENFSDKMNQVIKLLQKYPGYSDVIFVQQPLRKPFQLKQVKQVEITNQLVQELKDKLGEDNVATK